MTIQLHTLVHIGAGLGGQLSQHQALNASRIILIEPLPSQAQYQRNITADMENVEVWELAVSATHNSQTATLTEYNLAEASGLHPASGLLDLYPGIKIVQQHQVAILTPAALMERLQLPIDQAHQLVIAANGEETAIIEALAEQKLLTLFSHIELTLPATALYNSAYDPQAIQQLLCDHHFELQNDNIDISDNRVFSWQLNSLKQQLATAQQEITKYKGYSANHKKQHEAAELRITELTQTLNEKAEQLTSLKQQLAAQQNSQNSFSTLEQKIDKLFSNQAEKLLKSTNALGQHITKMHGDTQRQFQSSLAVHHSLQYGELPLKFGDASISTELAQYLIERIQRNNYDLIIEFGSGTSTLLFAKALLNKTLTKQPSHQQTIAYQQSSEKTQLSEYVKPADADLPKRVLSFEHNKHYYQQTKQQLAQENLEQIVDLQHAPLIDYQVANNQDNNSEQQSIDVLFYDCNDKFKQLAQLLNGREAHILVLVDGPSADQEQPLARYPALFCVLQHLSTHRLDIVLDDYHREGEQAVAKQWRTQLTDRDLTINEEILGTNNCALLLSIN